MSFHNQQDRVRVSDFLTSDNVATPIASVNMEEGAFAQFNLFVKAQAEDGSSMNLIYQGAVKRLAGADALLVGAIQQVSNRRDAGAANWVVQTTTDKESLKVSVTGENGVTIQWNCSLYMDWVF